MLYPEMLGLLEAFPRVGIKLVSFEQREGVWLAVAVGDKGAIKVEAPSLPRACMLLIERVAVAAVSGNWK